MNKIEKELAERIIERAIALPTFAKKQLPIFMKRIKEENENKAISLLICVALAISTDEKLFQEGMELFLEKQYSSIEKKH